MITTWCLRETALSLKWLTDVLKHTRGSVSVRLDFQGHRHSINNIMNTKRGNVFYCKSQPSVGLVLEWTAAVKVQGCNHIKVIILKYYPKLVLIIKSLVLFITFILDIWFTYLWNECQVLMLSIYPVLERFLSLWVTISIHWLVNILGALTNPNWKCLYGCVDR